MRPPECPRCGYDLSGKLESYRESCPVEDMCSECGCDFAWRSVTGKRACPAWFVERDQASLIKTAPLTALMLCRPYAWWRAVFMELEPRLGRAAVFLLVLYLAAGLVTSAALGVEAWQANRLLGGVAFQVSKVPETMTARIIGGVIFPLAERYVDPNYYFNLPYGHYNEELTMIDHLGVLPAVHNTPILVASVVTPLMFLVPVVTRERYKIRAAHIARVGVYGVAGAVALAFLTNVGSVIIFQYTPIWRWGPSAYLLPIVPLLLACVWGGVWWSAAARHYLRIERYRSFAWPLVATGVLAGLTAQFVLAFAVMNSALALDYVPGGNLF
ncbi:MAG: hypothetical protein AAFZ67_04770 [Planctomycetota bacterium]